ncbi:MAG: nucleotidyltransferase family protein [Candidatus Scalindua sp.]
MMNIEDIKSNVRKYCHQYHVKSLDLFGSVARGDYRKASDMDFLVEFEDSVPREYSKRFFGLLHSLEDAFHCNIDLLTAGSIRKKSLRRKIEMDRICLYER